MIITNKILQQLINEEFEHALEKRRALKEDAHPDPTGAKWDSGLDEATMDDVDEPTDDPDGKGRLVDLLKQATEILLNAQELTETIPELREYRGMVSKAENSVHVALTKVDDDSRGSW